jgi:hypothetical protein
MLQCNKFTPLHIKMQEFFCCNAIFFIFLLLFHAKIPAGKILTGIFSYLLVAIRNRFFYLPDKEMTNSYIFKPSIARASAELAN